MLKQIIDLKNKIEDEISEFWFRFEDYVDFCKHIDTLAYKLQKESDNIQREMIMITKRLEKIANELKKLNGEEVFESDDDDDELPF